MAAVQQCIVENPPENVLVEHLTTHVEGSVPRRVGIFLKACGRFPAAVWRSDLVHLHMADRGSTFRKLALLSVARSLRRPVVVHSHGFRFSDFFEGLPCGLRTIIRRRLNKSACFVALSDRQAGMYRQTVGVADSILTVLPNPVKWPEEMPARTQRDTVDFVFLGRIGERKGAFDLLEAFSQLPPSVLERSRLTLAGDGEVALAQRRAAELCVSERVEAPGWIDSEVRSRLLAEASVFVLASHHEALPMALLEAMSMGLPVITTDVGGIPDLIQHEGNGLIVAPGDILGLRDQMERLALNDALRTKLGTAAWRRVESCSLPRFREALGRIYRSAVSEACEPSPE